MEAGVGEWYVWEGRVSSLSLTFHARSVGVLYIFQSRHNVPIHLQEKSIRNESKEEDLVHSHCFPPFSHTQTAPVPVPTLMDMV